MAFPDDARIKTFSDGDALTAAEVNAMQDGTIAKRSKTYSRRTHVSAGQGAGDFGDYYYETFTASESLTVPIEVEDGERLLSVEAKVNAVEPIGDNDVTMTILRNGVSIGSATSVGGGSDETIEASGLSEDVGTGDSVYSAKFTFSGTGPWRVYAVKANFGPQP